LPGAFELTPEGISALEDVDVSESICTRPVTKLDFLIIAVLLLVIGDTIFQRLHRNVSPAVSSSLEKSIAVLPFENFSEDKAFAFFADGVQDEILDLAKIADLKVIVVKRNAIQIERRSRSSPDRSTAWRGARPRRQRAALREPCPHAPVNRCPQRLRMSGPKDMTRPGRCLCHPKRDC
jgi:hypothetical protein